MTDATETFEAAARAYCELIDRHPERSCGEFLLDVLPMLAELLATGHRLPDVGADANVETAGVPQNDWQRLFASLTNLLGPLDFYRDGGDPYSFADAELLTGSLADDLADVWRDMREGLVALDSGAQREAVIWQWRWGLQSHWGSHAASALNVLQHLHSSFALDGLPEDAVSIYAGTNQPPRHSGNRMPCPCCGYLTFHGEPPDDADDPNALCPVCGWISDGLQNAHPKASGMPNPYSLEDSRRNFLQDGAAIPGDDRVRAPRDEEMPR